MSFIGGSSVFITSVKSHQARLNSAMASSSTCFCDLIIACDQEPPNYGSYLWPCRSTKLATYFFFAQQVLRSAE